MKPHVLLVEDQPAEAQKMRTSLEKLGLQVTLAANGYEAIDCVYAHPEKFSVLFVEANLPVLTGAMVVQKVSEISPRLKSILVSSQ